MAKLAYKSNRRSDLIKEHLRGANNDRIARLVENCEIPSMEKERRKRTLIAIREGAVYNISAEDLQAYLSLLAPLSEDNLQVSNSTMLAGLISQYAEPIKESAIKESHINRFNNELDYLKQRHPDFNYNDVDEMCSASEAAQSFINILRGITQSIYENKQHKLNTIKRSILERKINEAPEMKDKIKSIIYDTFDDTSVQLAYNFLFNKVLDDVTKMRDVVYTYLTSGPLTAEGDVILGAYLKDNKMENCEEKTLIEHFGYETAFKIANSAAPMMLREAVNGKIFNITISEGKFKIAALNNHRINEGDEILDNIVAMVLATYPEGLDIPEDELNEFIKTKTGLDSDKIDSMALSQELSKHKITITFNSEFDMTDGEPPNQGI